MERIIEIPEGYEARIESNKVILEPKESEDERIRKELIRFLQDEIDSINRLVSGDYDDRDADDIAHQKWCEKALAWLEKQGSQNLANSEKTCKVEPKFKIGDKIKYAGQPDRCAERIIAIRNDAYYFSEVVSLPFIEQDRWELVGKKPADKVEAKQIQIEKGKWYVCDTSRYADFAVGKAYYCPKNGMLKPNENEMARYVAKYCFHLWTIQDAKEGDVLYENSTKSILMFKSQTCGWIKVYCDYWIVKDKFTGTDHADYGRLSEMEFTPATKEQRDLLFRKMKEAGYEWDAEKKELKKIEQNTAWSKEDEVNFHDAMWAIEQARITAKDENDMGNLWYAERWLKSLKERCTWKPSDEQMEALKHIADGWAASDSERMNINALYNDLKKLTE